MEIGAHALPVPGLKPLYVDRVVAFAGVAGKIDIQADGLALPIPDGTLDYLCSSHVLEHLVNPVIALLEWHRVLRGGGFLYLVVPDKRYTFDEPRPLTPPEHIIADFRNATTKVEPAHVAEFIYQTDWNRLRPDIKPEQRAEHQRFFHDEYVRLAAEGKFVDVHCHTFTPNSLLALLAAAGIAGEANSLFRVVDSAERYPAERGDGIGFLLQKTGRSGTHSPPETYRYRRAGDAGEGIPLVCPVSGAPLTLAGENGERRLGVAGGSFSYEIANGIPVLVPAEGRAPIRPWDKRWRRNLWLAGMRVPFLSFR